MKIVYVHPSLRNKAVLAAIVAIGYLLLLLCGFYFSREEVGGVVAQNQTFIQIKSFSG